MGWKYTRQLLEDAVSHSVSIAGVLRYLGVRQSGGRPYVCEACGNDGTWLGQPITLHVDHINGDYLDNRPENLRFLCPNCHAQTPTHAGRNRFRSSPAN